MIDFNLTLEHLINLFDGRVRITVLGFNDRSLLPLVNNVSTSEITLLLLMFKSSYSLKPSGGLDHPGSEFPGRH